MFGYDDSLLDVLYCFSQRPCTRIEVKPSVNPSSFTQPYVLTPRHLTILFSLFNFGRMLLLYFYLHKTVSYTDGLDGYDTHPHGRNDAQRTNFFRFGIGSQSIPLLPLYVQGQKYTAITSLCVLSFNKDNYTTSQQHLIQLNSSLISSHVNSMLNTS